LPSKIFHGLKTKLVAHGVTFCADDWRERVRADRAIFARRRFGSASAAGPPSGVADVAMKGPLSPSVYLAIDTDGTTYIVAHRSEMGSGSKTALPRIVADELDADWARVKIVAGHGR